MSSQTIPVWIEAIVALTVDPPEVDGEPDWLTFDLTPAAEAAFPGADIVAACTIDRVHAVMDQETANNVERMEEVRRLLTIVIDSVRTGFATPADMVTSLTNIQSMIPQRDDRPNQIAERADNGARS